MIPAPVLSTIQPPRPQRASGSVRLRVREDAGAQRLQGLYQSGSAQVRFPAKRPAEAVEAVLINTAGGLCGGDRFGWRVEVGPDARCQVITQACEKIYRTEGEAAEVEVTLEVGPGGRLDWTPQETILFDRARLSRRLEADLAAHARLLIVEAVILGRAAMGETVTRGLLRDRWRVRREGRLVFAEELRIDGAFEHPLGSPSALAGAGAFATIVLLGEDAEGLASPLRTAVGDHGGVSAFEGRLICRVLAPNGAALRRTLLPAMAVLCGDRPPPRVWVN